MKLKALVIGCGRIGAFFDSPDSSEILTHANAYYKEERVGEIAFFDIDDKRTLEAATLWKGKALLSIDELKEYAPDLVSICVPDELHSQYIRLAAESNPSMILAEKPITDRLNLSYELLDLLQSKKIPCNVNYSRRFDTYLRQLYEEFSKGRLGTILSVQAVYGKGLLHNGSHLIDLLVWFFGSVQKMKALNSVKDFREEDPSVGFWMQCEKADSINVSVVDSRVYTAFELTFYFENAKVSFTRGGLECEVTMVEEDGLFEGYRDLITPKAIETSLSLAMSCYVKNSIDALSGKESLFSPIGNAVYVQEVCTELLKG